MSAGLRAFIGEVLGTALLVLFGCGAVAMSVLFDAHSGLFQVATLWGMGVAMAIYATRSLSGAHLNPAVSIALAASGRFEWRCVPLYIGAQLLGALVGAGILYVLVADSIAAFEAANGIVRGSAESIRTAMIFGEFYPNPGAGPNARVSMPLAMGAEALGTFLLVLLVLALTDDANPGRPDASLVPCAIGLGLASIICLIAPLTQAGLNPARDLMPRLLAATMGWGRAAFPDAVGGFAWVYIAAPILGGILASLLYSNVLSPAFASARR